MRKTVSSLAALFVIFVAVTMLALESSDVVIVETVTSSTNQSNSLRRTHIWYVQTQNGLVLEAGNPRNPWVKDMQSDANITLVGESLDGRYLAQLDSTAASHTNIRQLMREKYGWRDWWVDMLFDTSESQLVNLSKL